MAEPTMEALARRLDRVERENRRLKGAGIVALAVIAAVGLMGQVSPSSPWKYIDAETFNLRNTKGEILGGMSADEKGNPFFALYASKKGEKGPRFTIAVNDDQVMTLNLYGDAKSQATLTPHRLSFKVDGKIIWSAP